MGFKMSSETRPWIIQIRSWVRERSRHDLCEISNIIQHNITQTLQIVFKTPMTLYRDPTRHVYLFLYKLQSSTSVGSYCCRYFPKTVSKRTTRCLLWFCVRCDRHRVILILFASKDTLRVSCLDTPSFDNPGRDRLVSESPYVMLGKPSNLIFEWLFVRHGCSSTDCVYFY